MYTVKNWKKLSYYGTKFGNRLVGQFNIKNYP
jgi:hypothetical protein